LLGSVFACTPIISTELKARVDSSISFKEIQENPVAYKGKIVLWGGEIIQTLPQENGTTLVEVLQWPLGFWGEPKQTVAFHGRFIVLVKGSLDPSVYKSEKRITLAGEIQGEIEGSKIKELTDSTYRYPVVLERKMHVWKNSSYPYSSVPDYPTTWDYRPTLR